MSGSDRSSADAAPRRVMVWFKATAPGKRNDGSSLVTTRIVEALLPEWEIHLVCLEGPIDRDREGAAAQQLFTSITVLQPPHQRDRLRRLAYLGWYLVLQVLGIRPLAASVEASRAVRRGLAAVSLDTGAEVCLAEYWCGFGALAASATPRWLIIHDVEHQNVIERSSGKRRVDRMWARWRAAAVARTESRAVRSADRTFFLSQEDARSFATDTSSETSAVLAVPGSFALDGAALQRDEATLVVLGGLDWWPNVDGLCWFVEEVWPRIKGQVPLSRLVVAGGGTVPQYLAAQIGVEFAGFVEDLELLLRTATIGVVPIRKGSGVKTKTIEMMSHGLPVVATTAGMRGVQVSESSAIVTDDAEAFAVAVIDLLNNEVRRRELGAMGRAAVRSRHDAAHVREAFA